MLESGWDNDESGMRLERDRQMWLHSAEGMTKVIILVKFRKMERKTVRARIDIWHPNELGVMICERRVSTRTGQLDSWMLKSLVANSLIVCYQ